MTIIPDDEMQRIRALGYDGLMHEIAEGKHCQPTSQYRDAVDAVLFSLKASEDAAALARSEAREEINSSIARKALFNSYAANVLAAIATIIALIAIFK